MRRTKCGCLTRVHSNGFVWGLGSMTTGRATCQPGWKWSVDVGPDVGATRCNVEHVGMVLSGCATAAMDDGPSIYEAPTRPPMWEFLNRSSIERGEPLNVKARLAASIRTPPPRAACRHALTSSSPASAPAPEGLENQACQRDEFRSTLSRMSPLPDRR